MSKNKTHPLSGIIIEDLNKYQSIYDAKNEFSQVLPEKKTTFISAVLDAGHFL